MASGTQRVVIVDDHPLLAFGLQAQLQQTGLEVDVIDPAQDPDAQSAAAAANDLAADLVSRIVADDAELVVVDLDLPFEQGGLGLTSALVARNQRVVVLTGSTDRTLWARCLENGAIAVLTKDEPLEMLIAEINKLVVGEPVKPHQRFELVGEYRRLEAERAARLRGFEQLSEREAQVLTGLMAGLSPASLAERDYVSVQTIRTQIKSVLSKLGVNSQLAAVARAYESGWDPDEED